MPVTFEFTLNRICIVHYTQPWLSLCIQGLSRNEKESLIPNGCHCAKTNYTGYNPNILVPPKINVLLMLIDSQFRHYGCQTKYCYGSYISVHH